MKRIRLTQWAITAVSVTLVVGACGGGSSDTVSAVSEQPTAQSAPAEGSETPAESGSDAPSQTDEAETSSTDQASAPPPPNGPAQESADPAENQLPDVDVVDLATDTEINLRTLAPAETPIVLWFWAPH